MQTRRDFLHSAALLTSGAFVRGSIPDAIARALAIDPAAGTTFLDAEHVVILMQENRSFDHASARCAACAASAIRARITLPNGNPVWFQTDAHGRHLRAVSARHQLDQRDVDRRTLPHSWTDQIDARNGGRYDQWLIAKPRKRDLPLTLGHYTRADIPFYYALADAFTICDQAFCSSLTGTTPNRLYLWTGTIRVAIRATSRACMNAERMYDREASWPTFPERLEDAGVSWRIYQNEISIDSGFERRTKTRGWQLRRQPHRVVHAVQRAASPRAGARTFRRSSPKRRIGFRRSERALQAQNLTPEARTKLQEEIATLRAAVQSGEIERTKYTDAAWNALSARAKALHQKAFTTNTGDPSYRSLTKLDIQRRRNAARDAACRVVTYCTSSGATCRVERCRRCHGSSRRRISPIIRARRGSARGMCPRCSTS